MEKTKQTRTLNKQFETREEGGKYFIEGYFAVFDEAYEIAPRIIERIEPTFFDSSMSGDVRALINHNADLVLGRTTAGTLTLSKDGHGLWGSIEINPEDTDAMNAYARVKRRDVTQASIGFVIIDESGQTLSDGTFETRLKDGILYEVTVCTFPAYMTTDLHARAKDLEAALARAHELYKQNLLERMRNTHGT
ncbi:MAG: HK97 family phage prohead protease [Clostridia bacterium]|nr:HK97 family phage prohead protease [Clostridia bacterium]